MPDYPYADFPASQATVDLATGNISYAEAGSLAESGTALGEIVTVAGEAVAAAALAEPLLILGAGLAAGAAAEAILNNLNKPTPKPQFNNNRRTGGRIGGNYIAEFKYKLQGQSEATNSVYVNGPVQGVQSADGPNNFVNYSIAGGGALVGILSAAKSLVEEPPFITNITKTDGSPADGPLINPDWVNPGTGNLPVPVPRDISFPGLSTPQTVTPYVLPSPRRQPGSQPQQPVSPGITVWVPEVGIVISFNPTNVNITFTQPVSTPNLTAPPISIDTQFKYPEDPCHCPEVDTTELLCRIKRLETDLLNNGYEYDSHSGFSGQGGFLDAGSDELVSVEVDVSEVSQYTKAQKSAPGTPLKEYLGWYAWARDGKPGLQQPIAWRQSSLLAPKFATGFMLSLYDGCSATVTYVTRKPKSYVDNC